MEYAEFENNLLSQLKNNKKECMLLINNNDKLVKLYLQNNEKPIHIKTFVNNLNDIILNKKDSFNLIEDVLKLDLFNEVLKEFRASDIFINACKKVNIPAIKWLQTMNINYSNQDENGMTALMYAAECPRLLFVVEDLIKNNEKFIHLSDKNGETALFHAAKNYDSLLKLLNTDINVNHKNNKEETLLIYCSKYDIIEAVKRIIRNSSNVDLDAVDEEGRTAFMYLLINKQFAVLDNCLRSKKKFNINYYNKKNNESFVSLLIRKYDEMYIKNHETYYDLNRHYTKCFANVFLSTIKYPGCNFNIPIDDDGNTPIMYFMMIGDYVTTSFILSDCKTLDLSVKNKHGVNASLLATYLDKKENYLIKAFVNNNTFDTQYVDSHNNNLLMYSIINDNPGLFLLLVNEKSINHLNDMNENALIIATKLGFLTNINKFQLQKSDLNHQDVLGNTAFYYAIKTRDKYAVNFFAFSKADIDIKNNDGISARDLLKDMDEKDILNILKKPISPYEMKEKLKKGNKSLFSFGKSKKNTDEKVDDYVKNYQINNYLNEYKSKIGNIMNYEEFKKFYYFNEPLSVAFFTYQYDGRRETFIPLLCCNPQEILDNRKSARYILV